LQEKPKASRSKALSSSWNRMKPIAYISDENYLALANVTVELESSTSGEHLLTQSSARGALYADIPAGNYRATLSKDGYGAKWVVCHLGSGEPYQFRLLSDCLLGFMWPKWIRSGEASEIRCHSPEQYQLTLWRYGLKKEFVRLLGWYDEHGPRSTVQITPDGDYSQVGVSWNECGYPAPHVQQFVAAPAKSGLYYLWGRTRGDKNFSFPWVVAPGEPSCKIAVLASTNTWNAYNNFGGRSNYINNGGLPPVPTVNARQDLLRYTSSKIPWLIADEDCKPLAFERPEPGNDIFDNPPWDDSSIMDPIQGRMQCGQAPGEWRLLGWLEREGFAYDYYAEGQLHEGVLPLDAYKILITSVHPEYWTREMFTKVDAWIRQGGRLIYLGGNGVNCEVILSGNATMRCLSFDDSSDPASGHESRMHRTFKPEASLLGVAFTERGAMTAAPYRTLAADHWVFAGTGLSNGELFGEKSLHERVPGGASGHETDKITPSSPEKVEHLAQGMNPDNGGADMVYFERDQGAVFSVGSITWVSSLFPDDRVSRITRNVIERFLQ
jgi:N,N-dimethylformamidase